MKRKKKTHFYGCTNLKTIILPNSVERIGIQVFYNCTSLEAIYSERTEPFISFSSRNNINKRTIYYYSETKPTSEGQFWHYGEDGKTPVIWPAYTTK